MHIKKLKKIRDWLNHKSFPLERLISLSKQGYLILVKGKKHKGVLIFSYENTSFITRFKVKLCNTKRIYKYEFAEVNMYMYETKKHLKKFISKHQLSYAFGIIND